MTLCVCVWVCTKQRTPVVLSNLRTVHARFESSLRVKIIACLEGRKSFTLPVPNGNLCLLSFDKVIGGPVPALPFVVNSRISSVVKFRRMPWY